MEGFVVLILLCFTLTSFDLRPPSSHAIPYLHSKQCACFKNCSTAERLD